MVGTTRWGRKINKNPDNNKNNADRQRFEGGFVKTDPPFDYLALRKRRTPGHSTLISPFSVRIPPKHVQFLCKPLKSTFLRTATTEFHG
ncbi:hypothetical protein C7H08_02630 [Marinobacter halophilus]|uniref:Uncharacterized protein n=1 Tax=Marinobacter halophilus TaxID=1323740 RepID=A0A2T1KJY8_9GAMM|nr:hypothetical protein C7H08_02630 [Marinobacter halophilus]